MSVSEFIKQMERRLPSNKVNDNFEEQEEEKDI